MRAPVEIHLDEAVRSERVSATPSPPGRSDLLPSSSARFHHLGELLRLGDVVDEAPLLRPIRAHAFGGGAENIGEIAAHFALVDEAGQAAGAGQHSQKRNFRKAHGGRAVVDHRDLVASERELVAATGGGAVQRGDELESRVRRSIFEAVARLVGELAEVHLGGMARVAEHVDVGAGAKHAALAARDDDGFDLGMLEADAVQRVGELDVDAEVVAVQLELVAWLERLVLGHVEVERGHRSVEGELPVVVAIGLGLEEIMSLPERELGKARAQRLAGSIERDIGAAVEAVAVGEQLADLVER